jgi:GTP-binding protein HflX
VRRVWLSAHSGAGLDLLAAALAERFGLRVARTRLHLGPQLGRARAELFRRDAVRRESVAEDGGWDIDVELPESELIELCAREGIVWGPPGTGAPCMPGNGFLQSRPAAAPTPS